MLGRKEKGRITTTIIQLWYSETLRLYHGFSVQTCKATRLASCNFSCLGDPTIVVQLCSPPCGCIFSRLVVFRPCRNPSLGRRGTSRPAGEARERSRSCDARSPAGDVLSPSPRSHSRPRGRDSHEALLGEALKTSLLLRGCVTQFLTDTPNLVVSRSCDRNLNKTLVSADSGDAPLDFQPQVEVRRSPGGQPPATGSLETSQQVPYIPKPSL